MGKVVEIAAVGAVLFATWWWIRPRGLAAVFSAVVGLAVLTLIWVRVPTERPGAPKVHRDAGFVSSNTCRGCHPGEYDSWYQTYHRTMTQVASPESVLAPFEGVLEERGRRFELKTEDERYYARMLEDPDSEWQQVVMTTGSHHMQTYWMAWDGWYMQLPWLWRITTEEWVPTADSFLQPPSREVERPAIWNRGCLHCHTTGGDPGPADLNVDPDSRVAEFGIACEACHRDAAEHVAAMRNPFERYLRHYDDESDPTLVNPREADHQTQSAVCGRCHSVHVPFPEKVDLVDALLPGEPLQNDRVVVRVSANPVPRRERMLQPREGVEPVVSVEGVDGVNQAKLVGVAGVAMYLGSPELQTPSLATVKVTDPSDNRDHWLRGRLNPYPGGAEFTLQGVPPGIVRTLANVLGYGALSPSLFELDSFWHDGTNRTVGREYNGMTNSACYTRGTISCNSCHSMHDYADTDDMLAPGMDGDKACLQCHEALAKDVSAHTHHPADSSGSRCMNCHMPNTTYGLLAATRAHDIDSPSPAMSAHTGRPNACNLCHLDETLAWADEHRVDWWGGAPGDFDADERTYAAAVVWLTRGDAAQRAITAWNANWGPARAVSGRAWLVPLLADLLNDDYAAVRAVAETSLAEELEGLDYTYYETKRSPAVGAILSSWADRKDSRAESKLGLVAPGVRDHRALQRLRSQRDRRPVRISE